MTKIPHLLRNVLSRPHIRGLGAVICLTVILSGGAFFLASLPPEDPDGDTVLILDQLTPEELSATDNDALDRDLSQALEEEQGGLYAGIISTGDTAGGLLQTWLSAQETHNLLALCDPVYPLSRIRAGQPYMALTDQDGLARFEYEIDSEKKLVLSREGASYSAVLEVIAYDVRLEKVEGFIEASLFLSMDSLGESPSLALALAEIFAWEINFLRDIHPGDSFSVLVEKRYRNGTFNSYGNLLAAKFVNQGKVYEAYSFPAPGNGPTGYYTAGGDSVKRAFLKAPLAFTRISSGFNLRRLHPIFHEVRQHPAIDYAAPAGTPVKAIGNGQVVFLGAGKGAGNYITLKHFNGYESMYLHLNGFARGLSKGKKVAQGEIIGYVGSSGYATGPHLDFRMKKDGAYINPGATLSPRAEPLASGALEEFKTRRDLYRQYLGGERSLAEYRRDANAVLAKDRALQ
ncbi:MAG: peptidoglycan DD-metalloendopeptidase family protein [Deltaproteobacteria bacterium]|jgi:murein DD-endopeptidase MepM/ murein hydrolase activator NlpD|nr:peptidoglycan DD-metalloendopeptidase family protein [Deltaproteobacteria bacterium]